MTVTPTRARPTATTCCVPGCDQPRHEITSRNRSRFCSDHYYTRDQRLQTCTQPKSVPTDAALETLHQLRPPKPVREYPAAKASRGTSLKWGVDMTEHAMKCKVWHREADELIARRGGRRRARELDDVTRSAALARLAELTSGGERGVA